MDVDYGRAVAETDVFVFEAEQPIGYVVLIAEEDHLLVDNVAVEPACQGEGIGRQLLAFAEEVAETGGRRELRLYTNAAMTENIALYSRIGYREVERRSENGFDRVFFVKRLD